MYDTWISIISMTILHDVTFLDVLDDIMRNAADCQCKTVMSIIIIGYNLVCTAVTVAQYRTAVYCCYLNDACPRISSD